MGQYKQALADYDRAINLNRIYVDAYYNKGLICVKLGYKDEAVSAFKSFLQYKQPEVPGREIAERYIKEFGAK